MRILPAPSARTRKVFPLVAAASVGLGLLLSGCNGNATPAGTASGSDTIDVVAVTNVYGSIVSAIGGDHVSVKSIITSTSQDPHSYETTAQDKLAVDKAALLVENGGGYDDFFSKLADGSDKSKLIDVVDLSGLKTAQNADEFNEHVWYSLPTISKLADTLASKLGALDSAHAEEFNTNAGKFKDSLTGIENKLDQLKSTAKGQPVAITEPVPLWMLESAGLVNKTPEAYSHAIEEGSDVAPAVLKATTDLISSKSVKLLAYNDQTEGPQTEALKKAADAAGVPVVNFTETLPEGKDYLGWMQQNADNIAQALNK